MRVMRLARLGPPAVAATSEAACWGALGPRVRIPQRKCPTNEPSRGNAPERKCGISAPSCPSSFSRLGRAPQDDGRCATQATLPQRGPKPAAWSILLDDATRSASTVAAAQQLPSPRKGLPLGRCASNKPRLLSQPPWRPRLLQTRGKASEMQRRRASKNARSVKTSCFLSRWLQLSAPVEEPP